MAETVCRDCGAPVNFRRHKDSGKWMILDDAPTPDGNIVLLPQNRCRVLSAEEKGQRQPGAVFYVDHHVTCPDAAKWRKNGA